MICNKVVVENVIFCFEFSKNNELVDRYSATCLSKYEDEEADEECAARIAESLGFGSGGVSSQCARSAPHSVQ